MTVREQKSQLPMALALAEANAAFAGIDYFSIDCGASRDLRSIALMMREWLTREMQMLHYVLVPLRWKSMRAADAVVDTPSTVDARQRVFYIYDPKPAAAATTRLSETKQRADITRKMRQYEHATLVVQHSRNDTCEVLVMPRALFSRVLGAGYAYSYFQLPVTPPPRFVMVPMLSAYLQARPVMIFRDDEFTRVPDIFASFALAVPQLVALARQLANETGGGVVATAAAGATSSATGSSGSNTPFEMAATGLEIASAISMTASGVTSDDEDESRAADNSDRAKQRRQMRVDRRDGYATPLDNGGGDDNDDNVDRAQLFSTLDALAQDTRRSGAQVHPFYEQMCDTEWLTTLCCWFVAAFKVVFYNEADGKLDRAWSYADLFYVLNQMRAHADAEPEVAAQRRTLGNEREFRYRPSAACNAAPRNVRSAADELVRRVDRRAFVNDARHVEIVSERLARMVTEALYYSPGIFERTASIVSAYNLPELLNRYQVRGSPRERRNTAAMQPCERIAREYANDVVTEFCTTQALHFEMQRLRQLVHASPHTNCMDVVIELRLDAAPEVTPLALVSSVREWAPEARAGCDFMLLFTPLSYVDKAEHELHTEIQQRMPPNNPRSAAEQLAFSRRRLGSRSVASNGTASAPSSQSHATVEDGDDDGADEADDFDETVLHGSTEMPSTTSAALTASTGGDDDDKSKRNKAKRKSGLTTLAPPVAMLLMRRTVWQTVQKAVSSAVLLQRGRMDSELATPCITNSFVPLCGPLVAETLCDPTSSLEALCAALNATSAVFGGAACEWSATSQRGKLYARRSAALLARFCHLLLHSDNRRDSALLYMLFEPLHLRKTSVECTLEESSNEDASAHSFYAVVQLILDGNTMPVVCADESTWLLLRGMCSASTAWTNYFYYCMARQERALVAPASRARPSVPQPRVPPSSVEEEDIPPPLPLSPSPMMDEGDEAEDEKVVECECGGAMVEECDRLKEARGRRCCVCTLCVADVVDVRMAKDALLRSSQFDYFGGMCQWCKLRVPLRGAHRMMWRGNDNKTKQNIIAHPAAMTIYDPHDAHANGAEHALTCIDLLDYLLSQCEKYPERVSDTLLCMRALRFNLRGFASRITLPRSKRLLRNDLVRINNAMADHAEKILMAKAMLPDTPEQRAKLSEELYASIDATHLGRTLSSTLLVRRATPMRVDTRHSSDTLAAAKFSALACMLTALELTALASHRPVVQQYELVRDEATPTHEQWGMKRALVDLLIPLRTAADAYTYCNNVRDHFPLFPLCRSAVAEATTYGRRTLTTLISSRSAPLRTTLDNMFFNKTLERPAALAAPGLLEFLFINAANLDTPPPRLPSPPPAPPPAAPAMQVELADHLAAYGIDLDAEEESPEAFEARVQEALREREAAWRRKPSAATTMTT